MQSRRFSIASRRALLALAVIVPLVVAGCQPSGARAIVGTWVTQLVGFNAAGATKYTQTVVLSENGTIDVKRTLPAPYTHQTGTYKVAKVDSRTVIQVTWTDPPARPSTLYFKVQGNQMLTSPTAGGLAKNPNLNAANQDPIVYTRQ